MSVIPFSANSAAPSIDLSHSSMRVLRSIIHTISLLEKSMNGHQKETPPFLEEWVTEAFALLKQFSTRIDQKSKQYGPQHFDPILHVAAKEAHGTKNDLNSLITFKNTVTEAMSQSKN